MSAAAFPFNANFSGTVSAPLFVSNQVLIAPVAAGTTSNVALDGIVSNHLRMIPIEFTNGIAFALDFLGYPVEVSKCDQVISVCAHERKMSSQQAALQSRIIIGDTPC